MRKSKFPFLLGAGMLLVAHSTSTASEATPGVYDSSKVREVVERTKTTRKTYAVYNWYWIKLDDAEPIEEWRAEFNSGSFHRVETPRDRVVANCDAKTGSILSLRSGKIVSGPQIANTACGIDTNRAFISGKWLGIIRTSCGKADRIRLVDADYIRTYDINEDGIIVQSVYAKNIPLAPPALIDLVAICSSDLPGTSIFDEQSLQKSYVPEKYKNAPPRGNKKAR